MRATYVWLARLIAIGVVLQAAFIAFGTFEVFSDASDGQVFTEDSDYNAGQSLHATVGMIVIPLLALILLVVAFLAKVPRGMQLAWAVVGLIALQIALAFVSFGAPAVGILHGLNAFAIAGVAGLAGRQAERSGAGSDREAAAA